MWVQRLTTREPDLDMIAVAIKSVEAVIDWEAYFKLVIEAPLIAKSRKAGHFVIVRVGEKGERMPLTIAGADPVKGTITLCLLYTSRCV